MQQRLDTWELPSLKEPLAKPKIQAIESSRDVADLAKGDPSLSNSVQEALQVKETAVALDMQLVEGLGGIAAQLLSQGLLMV